MYKSFTANDLKKYYGFPEDYRVDAFLIYGSYQDSPYATIEQCLIDLGYKAKINNIPHKFFKDIIEISIDHKNYWFVTAYGGALLSEWLHIACMFGSKINIAVGKCGGLIKGAISGNIIIPTYSYANESTTRAYEPEAENKHFANEGLREALIHKFGDVKVWNGPTITHQAMLAETHEDIAAWSRDGYYGVEMESGTVFAVSNHFKVPAVALLMISDNLIENETVLDINYENSRLHRSEIMMTIIKTSLPVLIGAP